MKLDLEKQLKSLITEGEQVLASQYTSSARDYNPFVNDRRPSWVGLELYEKWRAKCLNLMRILGETSKPWQMTFESDSNTPINAARMLATLKGIAEEGANGLLSRTRDLVFAEAFDNLLEQADHLFSQGYFLAAGVLGRAVLEEHLRNWCDTAGCVPTKAKPTLNDFKMELQKASHLTVTQAKHVDAMAGVGNDAAHNKGMLKADDVERLLRDVREFIGKYP